MEPTPVFVFAFANDQQQTLRLNEEWRQVEKALQHAEDAAKLTTNITPGAIYEDIWEKFNRFHGRIALFHYSGHSDGKELKLEDQPLKGESLATLLGQEKHLKLVLLNGCKNAKQVESLFQKGVPSVIATSVPIHDDRAISFARQFYAALSAGRSLQQAFELAAAYVNNATKEVLIDTRIRGFEMEEKESEFEWGLYTQDKASLSWQIPEPNPQSSQTPAQQINNYGNVGKQINIQENHGDIHM